VVVVEHGANVLGQEEWVEAEQFHNAPLCTAQAQALATELCRLCSLLDAFGLLLQSG
jgi:hypothetical protein